MTAARGTAAIHTGACTLDARYFTFSPVYFRNATAYGVSRRLRADIVVNNLAGHAVTSGKVLLQSDGTPWRPLVHIRDIINACAVALTAPRETIHKQAFATIGSALSKPSRPCPASVRPGR